MTSAVSTMTTSARHFVRENPSDHVVLARSRSQLTIVNNDVRTPERV